MSAISDIAKAEYEGLWYGKFMVRETVKSLDITFSKLMQSEVHHATGQVLYYKCINDWNLLFLVAVASHG